MATLTITVPNAVATRCTTAVCARQGYQALLPDANGNLTIPNPQTPQEFTRQFIISVVKAEVVAYESQQAGIAAANTASANATTQIQIT